MNPDPELSVLGFLPFGVPERNEGHVFEAEHFVDWLDRDLAPRPMRVRHDPVSLTPQVGAWRSFRVLAADPPRPRGLLCLGEFNEAGAGWCDELRSRLQPRWGPPKTNWGLSLGAWLLLNDDGTVAAAEPREISITSEPAIEGAVILAVAERALAWWDVLTGDALAPQTYSED